MIELMILRFKFLLYRMTFGNVVHEDNHAADLIMIHVIGNGHVEENFVTMIGMKSDLTRLVAVRFCETFAPLTSFLFGNEVKTILAKNRNRVYSEDGFNGRRRIPDVVLLIRNEHYIPRILE